MPQPAFQVPSLSRGHVLPLRRAGTKIGFVRRRATTYSRRRVYACIPRPSEDEKIPEEATSEPAKAKTSAEALDDLELDLEPEARESMIELDMLAEQWVGSDLRRWEWYERVKGRRDRLLQVQKETNDQMDEELQDMRGALQDFDDLFGTETIKDNNVTASGWVLLGFVFMLYGFIGYWAFQLVSSFISTLTPPSFP